MLRENLMKEKKMTWEEGRREGIKEEKERNKQIKEKIINEQKIEMIKKMKKQGIELNIISLITGFSLEKISSEI